MLRTEGNPLRALRLRAGAFRGDRASTGARPVRRSRSSGSLEDSHYARSRAITRTHASPFGEWRASGLWVITIWGTRDHRQGDSTHVHRFLTFSMKNYSFGLATTLALVVTLALVGAPG